MCRWSLSPLRTPGYGVRLVYMPKRGWRPRARRHPAEQREADGERRDAACGERRLGHAFLLHPPVGVVPVCPLAGFPTAGIFTLRTLGLGEDWLEVRDETSRRREVDPWPAKVAADRAFVDVVLGRAVDPDRSPPDHAEALRSHRVACALPITIASGRPEQLR